MGDAGRELKNTVQDRESYHCGNCGTAFQADVTTWINAAGDADKSEALRQWRFNIIQCPFCGCRHYARTPFFYEDDELGMLVAVFSSFPSNNQDVETTIRRRFERYPLVECFYDATQIWLLANLRGYYRGGAAGETGNNRARRVLRFIKEDPQMISVREQVTDYFLGAADRSAVDAAVQRVIRALDGAQGTVS